MRAVVQAAPHRLDVSMSAAYWDNHLRFFLANVVAAFWELGDMFGNGDMAIQVTHAKQMRPGLLQKAYDHVCDKKEHFSRLCNTMQASSVPSPGPC